MSLGVTEDEALTRFVNEGKDNSNSITTDCRMCMIVAPKVECTDETDQLKSTVLY